MISPAGRAAVRQALRASNGRLLSSSPMRGSHAERSTRQAASQVASSSRAPLNLQHSYHASARKSESSSPFQPSAKRLTSHEGAVEHVNVRLTPAAAESVEGIQQWLRAEFPTIPLPDDVAVRMVTHESWDAGEEGGHNRRLAFLGRRAMKFYLNLFLAQNQSIEGASSIHTNDRIDEILQTSMLGDKAGRHLRLVEVMRWTPAISAGQVGAKETGLFKIRGVTVEAFVGAVYHQHGAQVARHFFSSRILPQLSTFSESEMTLFEAAIKREAKQAEAQLQSVPQGRIETSKASSSLSVESDSSSARSHDVFSAPSATQAVSGRSSPKLGRRRSGIPSPASSVSLEEGASSRSAEGRHSANVTP